VLTFLRAKKQVTEQGGKIVNEFKLIKGFTYVLGDAFLTGFERTLL